jgi:hypothetical protein
MTQGYLTSDGRVSYNDRAEGNDRSAWERTMIDRSAASRALAKAIAYKECGKDHEAREWATSLIELLELADILDKDWA